MQKWVMPFAKRFNIAQMTQLPITPESTQVWIQRSLWSTDRTGKVNMGSCFISQMKVKAGTHTGIICCSQRSSSDPLFVAFKKVPEAVVMCARVWRICH